MKKFVVHTRPLPGCCQTSDAPSIVEVEGEVITAQEDPAVMWLPNHEYKFRILKPESLYEPKEVKKEDGSKAKEMVAPVYYNHSVYDTLAIARVKAEELIKAQFEFNLRKHGVPINQIELLEKCKEIQEILLS